MPTWKIGRIAEIAEQVSTAQKVIKFEETPSVYWYPQIQRNPVYFAAYKGQVAEIVHMTPDEYLREANKYTESDYLSPQKLKSIREGVEQGNEFEMPHLTYDAAGVITGQEGRNRAGVAKELGMKTIPVVIRRGREPNFELERAYSRGEITEDQAMEALGLKKPSVESGTQINKLAKKEEGQ